MARAVREGRRSLGSRTVAGTAGSDPAIAVLVKGQADAAADALTMSHADYPAFCHVFPERRRRIRALAPFFRATVRDAIPFGAVYGALGEGRDVVAVAVWLPPGAFPWSARRKARATPEFLRVLVSYPSAFRTFARYGSNAERAHPHEAHWYLEVLGVRPEWQRQRLGRRLMEPVLDRADRDGRPCLLETADRANVPYYERFGFTVVDHDLPLVPDGPTHVAMRRPARP